MLYNEEHKHAAAGPQQAACCNVTPILCSTFSRSFLSFRKINMKHTFIEQLRKVRQNLYVIHETIETSEEARYEESTEAEAKFMAQLYAKFSAKVGLLLSSGSPPPQPRTSLSPPMGFSLSRAPPGANRA